MIEADKRKAIYLLDQEGMSEWEISRRLAVSRNAVHAIIVQQGAMPVVERRKQQIDDELLRRLYNDCNGYAQRVHEKLTEEEGIAVTYPTLTRLLRVSGISTPVLTRCDRRPDEPGAEMQHDTTVYHEEVGGKFIKVVASILYLRYSKRRYLKFYRSFTRFRMKCFLHEALMYWGHAAADCIIDNTNLARLRGAGAKAVIVPEMEAFAKQYGTRFLCHEIDHANRKAGEERSFWTTETNFFPGRTFESMEDLNRQAFEWSTVRMENRPRSKTGQKILVIQFQLFEAGAGHLRQLQFGLFRGRRSLLPLGNILHAAPRRLYHLILCPAEAVDISVTESHRDVIAQLRHLKTSQFAVPSMFGNQFRHLRVPPPTWLRIKL